VADETTRVDRWLMTVLAADSTLAGLAVGGFHSDYAPRGTGSPWVVFAYLGGSDTMGVGATRVMHTGVWRVAAVAEAQTYAAVTALADRIDVLLHNQPAPASLAVGSVDGASLLSSVRDTPYRLAEEVDGRHYRTLGALYRIAVQL
jgi:hypothetical protein